MKVVYKILAAIFVLVVPAIFSEFPQVLISNKWLLYLYAPVVGFVFGGVCCGFRNYKYGIKVKGEGWNGTLIYFIIGTVISFTILLSIYFSYK